MHHTGMHSCSSKISTCSNGIMRPIMVWASPSSALAAPDGSVY